VRKRDREQNMILEFVSAIASASHCISVRFNVDERKEFFK
jgi:hypothetical protein